MTEAEWLAFDDPISPMLAFLDGKASDRKLRLFAVACCRKVWDSLTDERSQKAVEIAERFADKCASEDELHVAREESNAVRQAAYDGLEAHWSQENNDQCNFADYAADVAAPDAYTAARSAENKWNLNSDLLRDVFGPLPFRPITIDRTWLSSAVTALAQAIYDERAFDRMPILADALEDAGCTNQDILQHCRSGGEHVRGCWVVDLLLAKE